MLKVSFRLKAEKMMKKVDKTKWPSMVYRWAAETGAALKHQVVRRTPVGRWAKKGRGGRAVKLHAAINFDESLFAKGIARVGTKIPYAAYVEFGTGLYGPRRKLIRPRRAKVLRFWTKGGQIVFVRYVRGMKPRRMFAKGLKAEQPLANKRLDRHVKMNIERA